MITFTPSASESPAGGDPVRVHADRHTGLTSKQQGLVADVGGVVAGTDQPRLLVPVVRRNPD